MQREEEKVTYPYDTSFWGPSAWRFIYSVALTYPLEPDETDKDIYYQFFESLCFILPCSSCSENYKKRFEEHPIDLSSRSSLANWLSDLHNEINLENGKEIKSIHDFMKENGIPEVFLYGDEI